MNSIARHGAIRPTSSSKQTKARSLKHRSSDRKKDMARTSMNCCIPESWVRPG